MPPPTARALPDVGTASELGGKMGQLTLRPAGARGSDAASYEDHRDYVLSVLGRRCAWLDPSDREALFHEAYAVFLEKQHGGQLDVTPMRPAQIRAYLTQTALNKAMDEGKRAGRRRSVSLDDEDLGIDPVAPERELDERIAASFDDARIREIVAELPERQQTIIKLRFFFDRTPDEVQSYLGVTERVYRRELERATRHVAERVELVRQGTFCESRRSLILAFVTGVAGPSRIVDAQRHLATCPGCASWARDLRVTFDRAAEVIPLPVAGGSAFEIVHTHHHHLLGSHHPFARIGDLVHRARLHVVDLSARLDGSRVTTLAGARPGAAAMAVAGCLAAGTGGTYCAVNGVPRPLRALIGLPPAHLHAKPRHHAQRRAHPAHTAAKQHSGSRAGLAPPPPAPAAVSAMRSATVTSTSRPSRPVHRRSTPAAQTRDATAPAPAPAPATQSNPTVVERDTAPEFGVGTPSSSGSTSSGSTSGAATSGSSSSASSGSISPATSSGSTAPKPSSHSSEFDP